MQKAAQALADPRRRQQVFAVCQPGDKPRVPAVARAGP